MDYRTRLSIREFILFQVKLMIDGFKDGAIFVISFFAFGLDLVFKLRGRRRYFPRLMRVSRRFDAWLDLHGEVDRVDEDAEELFDLRSPGSDKLLEEIEGLGRRPDDAGRPPPGSDA